MRAWFNGLASRERRLLAGGAMVGVLLLLWAFVLYPQQRAHRAAVEAVKNSERDLAWMQQAAPALRGSSVANASARGAGRSLLAEVDSSARAAGLSSAIGRVEPQPNGRVTVSFNEVSFDALTQWLEAFTAQHGARVESLSAERVSGSGLVNARLTLLEAGRE